MRLLTSLLLVVPFLSGTQLCAGQMPPQTTRGQSVTFPTFDNMSLDGQAEYVSVMVDSTVNALRAAGNLADANKVEQLMTRTTPGSRMPLGLSEYENNEPKMRIADLERLQKDPHASRIEVVMGLLITLKLNGISVSPSLARSVTDSLVNWHPMTNAEFDALDRDSQRHYVALLMAIAYPDCELRERVKNTKDGRHDKILDDPALVSREYEILGKRFPTEVGNQPGFPELAEKIHEASTKDPNDSGVFFTARINILEILRADIHDQIKKMDDSTYHLPK